MTQASIRRNWNRHILDDGIIIPDSEDGFGGRVTITRDGKAWGFDKKARNFVMIRIKGESLESKGRPDK